MFLFEYGRIFFLPAFSLQSPLCAAYVFSCYIAMWSVLPLLCASANLSIEAIKNSKKGISFHDISKLRFSLNTAFLNVLKYSRNWYVSS